MVAEYGGLKGSHQQPKDQGLLPLNATGYKHHPRILIGMQEAGCTIQAEREPLPAKVFYYLVAPPVLAVQALL